MPSGRRASRLTALAVSVALVLSVTGLVPALAAGSPVVTFSLQPPSPDGSNGWYRTAPTARITSDQDGVLHFDWGSGESTADCVAGSPVTAGDAPEGVNTLTAFAVSSLGDTGTASTLTVHVDSEAPGRPDAPAASIVPAGVHLAWNPVTDATSGLAGYTVYRNLVGPPFSAGDAIAFVATPSYTDGSASPSGVWYYAVSASDHAGNESLLSDAVRFSADVTPPTAPGDLQAWLNADAFARVSWRPSIDFGSGVAYYVVERSVSGLDMSVVATVPASADSWDDFDPEAAAASDVSYQVTAYDRAGNASVVAGPVARGTDTGAPSKPGGFGVAVLPSPDGTYGTTLGVDFRTMWASSTDSISGIAGYDVYYGPDPVNPVFVRTVTDAFSMFVTGLESATWTFRVRAVDRAGNVSSLSAPVTGHGATVDRVAGADRIRTSVAVSAATFATAHTVVFASALAYPDGLAAASIAGAVHGPVLLVGAGVLPKVTTDELKRLGAADAYVIGGTPAVSSATFASIRSVLPGTVRRISGADRYATAAAVATTVAGLAGPRHRVYIVSGENFADALSCGSAAYVGRAPILFARRLSVPGITTATVRSLGVTQCVIVGGPAAVFGGLESVLPGATRVSGANRYLTSAAFADWAVGRGILTGARPVLVSGTLFPDGLSSAPMAGGRVGPVLLDPCVGLDPVPWLDAHKGTIVRATIVGGTPTIPAVDQRIVWWRLITPRPASPF